MLLLSRKVDDSVVIAGCIRVQIIGSDGHRVCLGIETPEKVPVRSREDYDEESRGPRIQETTLTLSASQGADVISAKTQSVMVADFSDAEYDAYFDDENAPIVTEYSPAYAAERGESVQHGELVRLSAELTRNRLTVHQHQGMVTIDFGYCEIWDGSDLCILRETMACLLDVMQFREVGINMQHAKSLASGFFGLLHDWHLRGVTVRLKDPQPCVRQMLWFREFCVEEHDGWYVIERRPEVEEEELRTYARLSRPTWRWGRPEESTI